jgi:hypothetical protein
LKHFYLQLIFILFITMANAQNGATYQIKGKVNADINDLEGINVENVESEKTTITDKQGYFYINARVGETLVLSSVQLKKVYRIINESDLDKELIYVSMSAKTVELKEVTIEKSEINAVSQGIVSKNQKTYTPAERKLYEATTGGGIVPLNPILNAISGRTAMLKKEIIVEKNEKSLYRLEYLFEENYFVEKLKIPQEFVKGFQYYAVENDDLQKALKAKNKTLAKFLMINLSKEYLQTIQSKD